MNTGTSRQTGGGGNTDMNTPHQRRNRRPKAKPKKENGAGADDVKTRCAQDRISASRDNSTDPLSLSDHLLPLGSPITKLFQSLIVELQPLEDEEVSKSKRWGTLLRASNIPRSQSEGTNVHTDHKDIAHFRDERSHKSASSLDNIDKDGVRGPYVYSPNNYHYKSLEEKIRVERTESSSMYSTDPNAYGTTRTSPSASVDADDVTVTASGSSQNIKRAQSLPVTASSDEQFRVSGKISFLDHEIATTEAKLRVLKLRKRELERHLKDTNVAQLMRPLSTSAPTRSGEINVSRRRKLKTLRSAGAVPTIGDKLSEKTAEATKRVQRKALWRERDIDADASLSLLHLWESIEIGSEKVDSPTSPNRKQIPKSNMPKKKQLFPRSA